MSDHVMHEWKWKCGAQAKIIETGCVRLKLRAARAGYRHMPRVMWDTVCIDRYKRDIWICDMYDRKERVVVFARQGMILK